ncbi:sphingosine 1-phosphate receptor 4 [Alosa pseudoharengus]|uniref:sphingosine 1-phosphate receptor 4 n=1 Tax=Alosa pseudoharengus TaxID=34774 RepID=UPI003F8B0ACD
MEALYSRSACPSMYGSDNSSVILQHYNYTGRLQHRQPRQGGISATTASFLFISICIILENLVVLMAVLFRIRLRSRWVYICIANITLSDLLAGVAYVVNLCMSGSRTFELSPALWLFREGLLFVALAASIFSLLLIAVERYTTMLKPLNQKSGKKTCRIYTMVLLCWVLACALGFLPLLGWNCMCNLERCSTLLPLYSKSYILFALILFFFILLAIGVLYSAIFLHVRKSTQSISQRGRGRSMRLLKTVITIVGVFSLCWGPLFFLLLVDFFCSSRDCRLLFSSDWVIAMAVLNSALNPIIYSLGSMELRKAIASILCCCCLWTGLIDPKTFMSKETGSTSGSRHDSLRNSFSKVRSMSTSPTPKPRKMRLSTTTSCLSVSSG